MRFFPSEPELAISQLASAGLLHHDLQGISKFLWEAHGSVVPAAVGRYLALPENKPLMQAYICQLDLEGNTPVQALRKMLERTRMPPSTKR